MLVINITDIFGPYLVQAGMASGLSTRCEPVLAMMMVFKLACYNWFGWDLVHVVLVHAWTICGKSLLGPPKDCYYLQFLGKVFCYMFTS